MYMVAHKWHEKNFIKVKNLLVENIRIENLKLLHVNLHK